MSAKSVKISPCTIGRERGSYVVSFVISGDRKTRGRDGDAPRREIVSYCSTLAEASGVATLADFDNGNRNGGGK